MSGRNRRGFTLVELLVVISIIGILAALLLPAINMAREMARKGQCQQRLAQVAQAAIAYESAKQRYPGYEQIVARRTNLPINHPSGANKPASWMVALFPYLDQLALYEMWDDPSVPYRIAAGPPATYNTELIPPLPFATCPSSDVYEPELPLNNICANAGFLPRSGDPAPLNSVTPPNDYRLRAQRAANGVFHSRILTKAKVSLSDLRRDGASNTILFGENSQAGTWNVTGKLATVIVWLYAQDEGIQVDTHVATGTKLAPQTPPFDRSRINGLTDAEEQLEAATARPSSQHPGGAHVSFADRHTKFISEQIEYHVYQALMTPNGRTSDMPYRTYVLKGSDYE